MTYFKNEPVTITFGTLKQSQNEAFQQGIAYAIQKLRDQQESEIADILEIQTKNITLYSVGA